MTRSGQAKRRRFASSARKAWALFALNTVFGLSALALAATQTLWEFELANLLWGLSFLAFGAVGALVASPRPENPIGWLFSGGATLVAGGLLVVEVATRASLARGGFWRPAGMAAWLGLVLSLVGMSLLFPATALHFPDGRLPSPQWRWIRRLLAGGLVVILATAALGPGVISIGVLSLAGQTQNPFGIEVPFLRVLRPIVLPLFAALVVAAFTAPYRRMRKAKGPERAQLKWFVYAEALMSVGLVTSVALSLGRPGEQAGAVVNVVTALGFMALPVAVGIAVLRHRLYEIDLVINRTLVYGILSVLLGAAYAAGVVVFSRLLPFGRDSDLAVAASTLAVVALFSPLRRRVQTFVDRRFYRARYNAGQTAAAFAAQVGSEVDISDLESDLLAVVQNTLQPTSVALWIQPVAVDRPADQIRA